MEVDSADDMDMMVCKNYIVFVNEVYVPLCVATYFCHQLETRTHTYMHARTYICTHARIYARTHVYIGKRTRTCTHSNSQRHAHSHACTHAGITKTHYRDNSHIVHTDWKVRGKSIILRVFLESQGKSGNLKILV